MRRNALVVGATGLIGGHLVRLLLEDPDYHEITVLTRKEFPLQHYKLAKRLVDFRKLESALRGVLVHDVFCALGTTIRKAGSQEAFKKVDFEYPLRTASAALKLGAKRFLVVSSIGADASSSYFYLRTKGELEKALSVEGFGGLMIFRPSLLLGQRSEFRLGERIALAAMRMVYPVMRGPLARYRPIEASVVATAMIAAAKQNLRDVHVFESDHILQISLFPMETIT
jgi:uncharacterized protein YbjT (DUF2867 family)